MGQAPGFVPFASSPDFTLRMFPLGIDPPAKDIKTAANR